MPLVLADRVRETTTVVGTNDATLLGAVTGFQSFAVVGDTNTCYYTIADNAGNWEVGIGTYSTSGPTLARTTVLSSSNAGLKVNFPAGTKDIFVTYPSEKSINLDESGYVDAGGSPNVSLNGNLTFIGTTRRITGDFSTSTLANRVAFQTSTTNGNTQVGILPNGTGSTAVFQAYGSSDPTNSSRFLAGVNGNALVEIRADISGTGTYLPMTFQTGGSERLRIDTSGNLLLGTSTSPASGSGSLNIGGYGTYTFTGGNGASGGNVITPLNAQNANLNITGATATEVLAANFRPQVSNDGSGGTQALTIRGVSSQPYITSSGASAVINLNGINTNAFRNYSTDISSSASNQAVGVLTGYGHEATLSTSAVTLNAFGYQAIGRALAGNITNYAAYVGQSQVLPTTGTVAITSLVGFNHSPGGIGTSTGTATVSNFYNFLGNGPNIGANGTVTNYYGLYLVAPTVTGTVTNRFSIYQADTAGANYFGASVGIGLTNPSSALHINRAGATETATKYTNGSAASGFVTGVNTSGIGLVYHIDSQPILFATNNTERMRILADGKIGIGTSAPTGSLNIGTNGSATATPTALLAYNGTVLGGTTDNMAYISEFGGSVSNNARLLFALRRTATGTDWLTSAWRIQPAIDSSFTAAGSNRGYLELAMGPNGPYTGVGISGAGNSTPDFIINGSGNVGIGTITPGGKLAVVTDANSAQWLAIRNNNAGSSATMGVLLGNNDNAAYGALLVNSSTNTTAPGGANSIVVGSYGSNHLTFVTSNTERARIDGSTGNFAIGTSSMTGKLNVTGGGVTGLFLSGASGSINSISLGRTAIETTYGIVASAGQFFSGSAVGDSVIAFGVGNLLIGSGDYDTPGSERMRIDSSGNVGIGTSSPGARLQVAGTSGTPQFLAGTSANAISLNVNNSGSIYLTSSVTNSTDFTIGTASSIPFVFFTNNSERMRIFSTGEVSIGTQNNIAKLGVFGGALGTNQGDQIMLEKNWSTAGNALFLEVSEIRTSAGSSWTTTGSRIQRKVDSTWHAYIQLGGTGIDEGMSFGTGGNTTSAVSTVERMRITNTGVVGIGTTNPDGSAKLDVAGNIVLTGQSTADQFIRVGSGRTGNGYSFIDLQGDTTYSNGLRLIRTNSGANSASNIEHRGTGGLQMVTQEAAPIVFYTSATERMRITSGGNVGIGTSSPSFQLHIVNGGGNSESVLAQYGSGTRALIGAYSNQVDFRAYNGTNDVMTFTTGSTERMRITSGGEVYIAGTTDQGAYNLQVNGTGVWGAGAYVNGSDARIKEDVAPLDFGLDVIAKLNPVTYRYKENWSKDQSVQPGFIAQDLLVALQDTNYVDGVVQQGGEYMSVAYQNLIPVLTKAIQEQQKMIEELTNRIKKLEGV